MIIFLLLQEKEIVLLVSYLSCAIVYRGAIVCKDSYFFLLSGKIKKALA